ncbi:Amidase chry2 [Paramyrothecium foliicola]|nr:Amidase chry2 [Paramyrothecium foliicola]
MCGIVGSFTSNSPQYLNDIRENFQSHHATTRVNTQNGDGTETQSKQLKASNLANQLTESIDAIKHRGPDGFGVWVAPDDSVGLAHCRLSIIDLTPTGAQPLHCDEGLVHAIVNGEIYDHDQLRKVCENEHDYKFTSQSDSELVIALYKIFGSPGLFEHLRGEFAFVLFDERKESRRVIAARDRFGIKPLFYTVVGNTFLFASEAKAFLPMGWEPEWNVEAIATQGWMVDDRTVFQNVKKVMPGHLFELSDERGLEIKQYWEADYPDKTKPDTRTIDEMVLGVRERLLEAVRVRLRADVPVGIYLSGGIDSSAIAGMVTELVRKENVKMGSEKSNRVTCFTIKFPHESGFNESDVADRTAEWLGVEMAKLDVNEQMLADSFADAVYHSEHHHFDLNSVAKYDLSSLPGKHGIKAVLTGEGSDEHFGGYLYFLPEFLRGPDLNLPDSTLTKENELRETLQQAVAGAMSAIWRSQGLDQYEGNPETDPALLQDFNGSRMPNHTLTVRPPDGLFSEKIHQHCQNIDMRVKMLESFPAEVRAKMREKWHPAHTAMHIGNKTMFMNILLSCLGDRAEMAHSIEARLPFLDHQLTEYVNLLPPSLKLRYTPPTESNNNQETNMWLKTAQSLLGSFTDKWILREAVRPYISDELYNRRKFPFLAPAHWPKDGPLHNMFRTLLTREAVEGLGFIQYAEVQKALEDSFGSEAKILSFRLLCATAGWVVLSQKFGVKKANF